MIRGEKVVLRAIEREDLDHLWLWANDAEVMYFWAEPSHAITRAALERQFERELKDQSGRQRWFIIQAEDGTPIGQVGYSALHPIARHAEFGIQIGEKRYWNGGYGTDTTRVFLRYVFAERGLHKLWLRTEQYNLRAQRVYEKCGFRRDGVLRDNVYVNGRYYDSILMSILESEWRALTPPPDPLP